MNVAGTSEGLPTDDDRPERRRRWLLVVVSIGLTLVIAGTLVLSAKSNPRLHPVAVPTTTSTTAATGDYATEVSAAITVVGLIVFVPILGAIGAAWVSLAAYTINFTITLVMFHHVTKIRYRDAMVPRKADVAWVWNFSIDLVRKGARLATGRRKGAGS